MTAFVRLEQVRITGPQDRALLDGVSIDLDEGSVTALIGPSGAGKSTLGYSILGRLSPGLRLTGGTVRIGGVDPFSAAGAALRGRITAFLPQDPASALDPSRRISAQLGMASRIAHPSSSRAERAALIQEATAAAALETTLLRRRVLQLSGGQAQRALLAWMFVVRPRVLVLDEPTSGLDSETAQQVSTAFTTLPWQPAVLLISHDLALAHRLADRVLHLENGQITAQTTPTAHAGPLDASSVPENLARTTPEAPVLTARDVTIRQSGHEVISGASLELRHGEMLAIRGRSGAGKTSLARALSGFAPPHTGTLLVNEHPVPWDAAQRVRTGSPYIASVGQDARAALHPTERVRVTLQRAIAATHLRQRATVIDETMLLDSVGLPRSILDRVPAELSGGQRHRLVLARALASSPAVLVCDETTAALDHDTADRVLDTLDDLRHTAGIGILLITHQDVVAARADHILTLSEGTLR